MNTDIESAVKSLSDRQREVLRLLIRLRRAKEVARVLGISDETVKKHLEQARKRLGAVTSDEAAGLLEKYDALNNIPPLGEYPKMGIAGMVGDLQPSAHERITSSKASSQSERQLSDSYLGRTGEILAGSGCTGEVGIHKADPHSAAERQPLGGLYPGNLYLDSGNGLADRRWGEFKRRLNAFRVWQWFGLIAVLAVVIPLFAGLLMGAVMVMLQGIAQLKGQTG